MVAWKAGRKWEKRWNDFLLIYVVLEAAESDGISGVQTHTAGVFIFETLYIYVQFS